MTEMALARLKQLSAHEVGHTLGLRHNMGASFATPVDKSATSATTDDKLLKTLEKTPQY